MLQGAESPGASSVFTVAKRTLARSCAAACSNAGAMPRHGPHQGAQKSTSTGKSLRAMKASNTASVRATGVPSNSGAPHLPHFGSSASLSSGARFDVKQREQATCSRVFVCTAAPSGGSGGSHFKPANIAAIAVEPDAVPARPFRSVHRVVGTLAKFLGVPRVARIGTRPDAHAHADQPVVEPDGHRGGGADFLAHRARAGALVRAGQD